jgi:hypothetical protein
MAFSNYIVNYPFDRSFDYPWSCNCSFDLGKEIVNYTIGNLHGKILFDVFSASSVKVEEVEVVKVMKSSF